MCSTGAPGLQKEGLPPVSALRWEHRPVTPPWGTHLEVLGAGGTATSGGSPPARPAAPPRRSMHRVRPHPSSAQAGSFLGGRAPRAREQDEAVPTEQRPTNGLASRGADGAAKSYQSARSSLLQGRLRTRPPQRSPRSPEDAVSCVPGAVWTEGRLRPNSACGGHARVHTHTRRAEHAGTHAHGSQGQACEPTGLRSILNKREDLQISPLSTRERKQTASYFQAEREGHL